MCEEEDSALEIWRSKCLRLCGRKGRAREEEIGRCDVKSRWEEALRSLLFQRTTIIHRIHQCVSATFLCNVLKKANNALFFNRNPLKGQSCCTAVPKRKYHLVLFLAVSLPGQDFLYVCVSKPSYKHESICIPHD